MKCALVGSAFRAKVLCAIFVIAVAAHLPAQITFNNFSSTTGLTLNGSAARSGNVLRLTPANVGQAGSAWFNTAQPLQQGFTTKFDFQVNGGGDGFAFVIQNQPITESQPNPLNALGAGAGGLGYGQGGNPGGAPGNGIQNSLAIEFDTFANGWDMPQGSEGLDGNHVAVQSCGTGANNQFHVNVDSDFNFTTSETPAFTACTLSFGDGQALAQLSFLESPITIADGNVHTVVIDYVPPPTCIECSGPGTLTISVSGPNGQNLQQVFNGGVPVTIENLLNLLAEGKAYVGFTGGTGGATETADILNWTLTPHTPMTIGPLHTTAGHTTIFNFGAFNFKSTPEDTISSQGDDLTVTAKLIDPGTPVTFGATKNATCIDYDNTGGSCWEFDVLCSGPDCGGSYDAEFATSYDHAATIVKPGFLKNHSASCPTTMFETNQIDGFFQTRIDPTTKAKSGGTGSCWLATQDTDGISDSVSNFIGFLDPVQNAAINVVKGGQAIPLKFQVLNSNGQPLTNLSLCTTGSCPTPSITIRFGPSSCTVDTDITDISGDLAATAGNAGLQNLGNGNYQYVWKTPNVKGCYFARVSLNDGIAHDALFKLK
ncbi:MAG: hypothetical protein DMG91_16075 [Acidobacteria bacterium]|jgi:Bacterial lectin|nr:MAG: hypothetical protein DMG91_16075 [Acidobacteriota bacterium]